MESHPRIDEAQKQLILDGLEANRLARIADLVLAAARPQLVLRAGEVEDDPKELGRSRLGGAPDLPPGSSWPEAKGRPLVFLAQLRFSELFVPFGWPLPEAGLLSVFKGNDDERFDVEHELIYSPEKEPLQRLDPPLLPEGERHLRACPVKSTLGLAVPGYGDPDWRTFGLDSGEIDRYFDFQDALPGGGVASLLGLDKDVDELPTERLAIDFLGGPPYDDAWKQRNLDRVRREARRWVPLFQMPSNSDIGLLLWDSYTFVVLIRWEDLVAGRFDRTRAHLARI